MEAAVQRAVACVPGAIAPEDRKVHFALAKRLFTDIANGREALPDGYAFRFPSEAIHAIAQFVANERKCCLFMQFDISVAPDAGPVWLRMTGPDGTRAVLEAELGLNSCGVQECGCMAVNASNTRSPVTAGTRVECNCGTSSSRLARWSTAAGLLSALGVCAACCLLPFVLIALGITSAWVGMLDALAPFKWYFVITAVGLLGYGFYATYFRAQPSCASGAQCTKFASMKSVRPGLWVGLVLILGGLIFEQIEPFLGE